MTDAQKTDGPIDVVGIGADGWDGLAAAARDVVARADVLFGSERQLGLVPDSVGAERVCWPIPLLPALRGVLDGYASRSRCVLASGDPMFYGIGSTLAGIYGSANLRVRPHPSSASLACARLGWSLHEVTVVSVVARPVEAVSAALFDGRRVLVLSENSDSVARISDVLSRSGFGGSTLTVLAQLGGPHESVHAGPASEWSTSSLEIDPLNVVAIDCLRDRDRPAVSTVPGLVDDLFVGDGQMTKNEVRAVTISALAPTPGELLWDVGGGSGTIAVEWMRTHPSCRAISFERSPERAETIATNARALGVPGVRVLGDAPASFGDLPGPDAVFVGGGATEPGLLDACWTRLRPGGRIVVNAVTAESEALLLQWFSTHGGSLRKFQIYRAEGLGSFTAWRPHLPVAQWICGKPFTTTEPEAGA